MLCVTRPLDSTMTLRIPPSGESREVTVQVVRISGDRVRLAIEAPRDIRIERDDWKEEPT